MISLITALLIQTAPAIPNPQLDPQCRPTQIVPHPSSRIRELLASTDGRSRERAFVVRNVREEYRIIEALGNCPHAQTLYIIDGVAYDRHTVYESQTGHYIAIWFDISYFFRPEG